MLLHSSSASLCSQQSAPTSTSPSSSNYHKLVATLSSSSQKPYGTIPRRRRNRASSTASITSTTLRSSQPSRNSLELLPTTSLLSTSATLPLPRPTSASSTTLWASLKAHYLATAQSFNWPTTSSTFKSSSSSTQSNTNNNTKNRRSTDCAREFLPPLALLVTNSSPVVTLNATPLILTSLEANDENSNSSAEEYPASVAAMDKFKVMRSDTIALKTFTYRETPVVEVKRPRTPLLTQRRRSDSSIPKPATAVIVTPIVAAAAAREEELLPLPRHLACRETRSNPDYLRMMASELRMIRARKLIAPLKPRSYLSRRRELFSPGIPSSCTLSPDSC